MTLKSCCGVVDWLPTVQPSLIEWYDIKVVLCSGVVGYLRYSHLLLNGMTLKSCCGVVDWLPTVQPSLIEWYDIKVVLCSGVVG